MLFNQLLDRFCQDPFFNRERTITTLAQPCDISRNITPDFTLTNQHPMTKWEEPFSHNALVCEWPDADMLTLSHQTTFGIMQHRLPPPRMKPQPAPLRDPDHIQPEQDQRDHVVIRRLPHLEGFQQDEGEAGHGDQPIRKSTILTAPINANVFHNSSQSRRQRNTSIGKVMPWGVVGEAGTSSEMRVVFSPKASRSSSPQRLTGNSHPTQEVSPIGFGPPARPSTIMASPTLRPESPFWQT